MRPAHLPTEIQNCVMESPSTLFQFFSRKGNDEIDYFYGLVNFII